MGIWGHPKKKYSKKPDIDNNKVKLFVLIKWTRCCLLVMNKSNRPVDADLDCSFGRLIINPLYVGSIVLNSEVGIYKRKQESMKTRKQELDQESDQEKFS